MKKMAIYKFVGSNIRKKRVELDLSQKQIADKLDIDYSYFGRMERGEQMISLSRLFQIAEILNTTVESLVRIPEDSKRVCRRLNEIIKDKPPEKVRLVEEIAQIILND